MEKEWYKEPDMEIIVLAWEDVVTGSDGYVEPPGGGVELPFHPWE